MVMHAPPASDLAETLDADLSCSAVKRCMLLQAEAAD